MADIDEIRTVRKRNGWTAPYDPEKIRVRLNNIVERSNLKHVDVAMLVKSVTRDLVDGVSTVEIDNQLARLAGANNIVHPEYNLFGGQIMATNLHRQINISFSENVLRLSKNVNRRTGKPAPILNQRFIDYVAEHAKELDELIDHTRDSRFTYFSICTIIKMYLAKIKVPNPNKGDEDIKEVVELPQFMFMRVAVWLGMKRGVDSIKKAYDLLSLGKCTFGSPTMYGCGCAGSSNLASCFLMTIESDSMPGICSTISDCAITSQSGGGLGVAISNLRCNGASISGGGSARGVVPVMGVLGKMLQYADQRDMRPGNSAVYLEVWHADLLDVLKFLKISGVEFNNNRNIFPALWICDLFMERIKTGGMWSLMCPSECPDLMDLHGDAFNAKYLEYESKGIYTKQVPIIDILDLICRANSETGLPYLCFKDTANRHNSQSHLGTLYSSNLCAEIFEHHTRMTKEQADYKKFNPNKPVPGYNKEIAVCNLATMCLPMYVKSTVDDPRIGSTLASTRYFDFDEFMHDVEQTVVCLNSVIDMTYYALEAMSDSNKSHRPIGLGVQGLADVFILLGLEYGSPESLKLTSKIAEAKHWAALASSIDLAQTDGPYSSFKDSLAARGILHCDGFKNNYASGNFNWEDMREAVAKYGLRNSLLCAWPPTATTSVVAGNNESFEPITYNVYNRDGLSGTFSVFNKHLVNDLIDLGLWSESVRLQIIANLGSVQAIDCIPDNIKAMYLTSYEIDPFSLIDVAAHAQPWVDQGMSLNWYRGEMNPIEFVMLMQYAHESELKTGKYYLHNKAASQRANYEVKKKAVTDSVPKVSVAPEGKTHEKDAGEEIEEVGEVAPFVCLRKPGCEACSS